MFMKHIVYLLLSFSCITIAGAQLKLPALITDSMVLQRDTKLKIWGWAEKGQSVKVSFNKQTLKAVADKNGKWLVLLMPVKAGGPYTMEITAEKKIILKDILVGDVWICSGQSNMVLSMERVKEKYPDEIANANIPQIRHFFIPTITDLRHPLDDLPPGYWRSAVKSDILTFSATAYFFAKTIYERYHVPIGLINASVGGTIAEAWISEAGLNQFQELIQKIEKNKDTADINGIIRKAVTFNRENAPKQDDDKGLSEKLKWYDTSIVPKDWNKINIPGYWEDQGVMDLNGVVWYRREIELPISINGIPVKVFMGRIVDADEMYINGKLVGNISYQYPPRRYEIPAGVLKAGKNVIVIRVTNNTGKGGFVPDKPYYLQAGEQKFDLKGEWLYKVGQVYKEYPAMPVISLQNQPAALYNAMIAPLINYAIKGFVWYQGEANTGKPSLYYQLLPALITDWRNQWKQPDAPFIYVQLANFMDVNYSPSESNWAELRNAQLKTLSVANTAMAVAIDLGEWNDIHPLNKKDVGYRLALGAEKVAYGENIVSSGPIYNDAVVEKDTVIISFSNTGGGLTANDGETLRQFAIAGADKKFVWANAKIKDDKVIVRSDDVTNPVYVRYAWADNPSGANLYNKEGLPASPFQAVLKR
jgi:sialate O-acetylesterase